MQHEFEHLGPTGPKVFPWKSIPEYWYDDSKEDIVSISSLTCVLSAKYKNKPRYSRPVVGSTTLRSKWLWAVRTSKENFPLSHLKYPKLHYVPPLLSQATKLEKALHPVSYKTK